MITKENRREHLYVATGSSIERLIQCASSIALPHLHYETAYSERGKAVHSFLEVHGSVGRVSALETVPHEWRAACEALDLTGVEHLLSLTAEIAIAYDVETDTARELGRGQGRVYHDVKETEIPCTLDVVGVREVDGRRIGIVVDWKSGWATRKKKIATDWQMRFAAIAAMRLFDLDEVEVQLINLSEDGRPYVQKRTYHAFDVARAVAEVRAFYGRAVEVRELHAENRLPEKYEIGEWCDQCPARASCPAQRALISGLLDRPITSRPIAELPDAEVAELRGKLQRLKKAVYAALEEIDNLVLAPGRGPLFLEKTAEGKLRFLASVVKEGNEFVDGPVTFAVVKELLGEEYATIAAPPDASKKGISLAVREAKKKGLVHAREGEKTVEKILAEVRKRGGTKRKAAAPKVEELLVDDVLPGAKMPAQLEEGDGDA